jgi:hypothetical protein
MPDTTTLRDAAEALLNEVEAWAAAHDDSNGIDPFFAFLQETRAARDALRAALDAEAAWRARAEPAIALLEAEAEVTAIHNRAWLVLAGVEPDEEWEKLVARYERGRIAARRRYEETCRG